MGTFLGNLRLTFAISIMAIGGIVIAILAVLGGLMFSLTSSVQTDVDNALRAGLRVASQTFNVSLPNMVVATDEDGYVTGLEVRTLPRFRTPDVMDMVARVSGHSVSLYVYNAEVGEDFSVGSTSRVDGDGARMNAPLTPDMPVYAALSAGQSYRDDMTIEGKAYAIIYQPIMHPDGNVLGAFRVDIDRTPLEAVIGQSMLALGAIGLMVMLVMGGVALIAARQLSHPIPRLSAVMAAIAEGDLDVDVPYHERRNEIGAMARAVEVFRANGAQKAVLDAQARQHMAEAADHTGQLRAISRAQLVAEFNLDGTLMHANENFLNLLGWSAEEIVGKPNALFLFDADPTSQTYLQFWQDLASGDFKSGEYRRRARDGREVWIQSTFTPIFGTDGVAYKVVQFALDVTARKQAVAAIGAGLKQLAEGDLTGRIETPFPPEFEDLRIALNATVERFCDVVGQLRTTTRSLRTASGELLSGANDLSERTTRQAATIEETSASMEQLASTVAGNAGMAEAAARQAENVSGSAAESGVVMNEATGAMERITQSSARISNIIGLIDDIAFQTNLLALNASVEAARAGDAGKGFAVVAVEVRRLAQSAASASADVKALVEQSGVEVKSGAGLVEVASEKLRTMLAAIEENVQLVRSIAQASREQAASIDEVNAAVRQLDQMTQHNAALVEETNAVVAQTESQTQALDMLVDIFVVEVSPSRGEDAEGMARRVA
jgi:methyl-accepting chemotaxis protein